MIFLCGGAGNGNLGDELIVDAWLAYLRQAGVGKNVVVGGFHADIHQHLFLKNYGDVRFTDVLGKLRNQGPDGFFASLRRGVNFFENGGFEKHPSIAHFYETIKDVEVFHLHGGGYLNTIWPKNAFMLGFAVALKRRFGPRIYGTGLGMMPLPAPTGDNAALVADVMTAFDFIETRDVESFNYVKAHARGANVVFGQDDCFLHMRTMSPADDRRGRWLHLSDFAGSGFVKDVVGIVDRTRRCFDRVVFWECMSRDSACADVVRSAGVEVEALTMERLIAEPLPVADGDVMLTARFHPHLLAARLGAEGFFRTDKSYYDVKHRSLVVNGSPFLDISAMTPDDIVAQISEKTRRVNFMSIARKEKFMAKKAVADAIYGCMR